jgi:hypothetical protein
VRWLKSVILPTLETKDQEDGGLRAARTKC